MHGTLLYMKVVFTNTFVGFIFPLRIYSPGLESLSQFPNPLFHLFLLVLRKVSF